MNTDKNLRFPNAARRGDVTEMRRLVVEEHADVNFIFCNWTALHYVAWYGHEGAARLLNDLGADLEASDRDGRKALHVAANAGRDGIVRLLHGFGADINAKDKYGWTPLHWSAFCGHGGDVRLLHSLGADIEAKANNSKTPRDLALDDNNQFIPYIFDELRNSPAMRRINILARPRPPAMRREIYVDTFEASGVAAYWAQCCGVTSSDVANILSFLDDSRDFGQARLVCKTWRRLADTTLESRSDEFFK